MPRFLRLFTDFALCLRCCEYIVVFLKRNMLFFFHRGPSIIIIHDSNFCGKMYPPPHVFAVFVLMNVFLGVMESGSYGKQRSSADTCPISDIKNFSVVFSFEIFPSQKHNSVGRYRINGVPLKNRILVPQSPPKEPCCHGNTESRPEKSDNLVQPLIPSRHSEFLLVSV